MLEKSSMSETVTDEFTGMITESIESRRRERGLEGAIAETARVYGLTVRRVRACLYREVRLVEAAEWISVRARFATHLEDEIRRLDAKAEMLRARLASHRGDAA